MRRSALAALGLLLTVTGCSAVADPPATDPAAAARAAVPAAVRDGGELTVGSDLTFEPMEYLDASGRPVGFEVELLGELAKRLDLRLNLVPTPWAQLRSDVAQGRLHAAMSTITDTAKRQQEVDFVDYLNVGSSIIVRSDVTGVRTLADLCGRRVAVMPESVYQDLAEAQAARCPAGRPLRPVVTPDDAEAVRVGRADAYLTDFPLAVAAAARHPQLQVVGEQIEAAPLGIAVAKQNRGLAKAFQLALYELFRDGTYDALLSKWNIGEGALRTGVINGGA